MLISPCDATRVFPQAARGSILYAVEKIRNEGGRRGSENKSAGGCRYVYTVVYTMPKIPE